MSQNPYDAPSTLTVHARSAKSRRVYWVASTITIGLLAIMLVVIALLTRMTISEGYVNIELPGSYTSTSPLGQRYSVYDTMVSTSFGGVIALLTILTSILLSAVNGVIFFWRRKKRLN